MKLPYLSPINPIFPAYKSDSVSITSVANMVTTTGIRYFFIKPSNISIQLPNLIPLPAIINGRLAVFNNSCKLSIFSDGIIVLSKCLLMIGKLLSSSISIKNP